MMQSASPAKTRDGSVEARRDTRRQGFFYSSLGQISGQTKSDGDMKMQAEREDRGMSEEEKWCLS